MYLKVLATDLADMILDVEAGEKYVMEFLIVLLWHKRGDTGPSSSRTNDFAWM